MRYTPDEFQALEDEINSQGGALLPDICTEDDVVFTCPPYKRNKTERRRTCGCGNLSRFVMEYDPGDDKSQFITACAVCDNMGSWPRLAIALSNAPEDDDEVED